MLDHISLAVRDLERAGRFYDRVLATVGLQRCLERAGAIGYGSEVTQSPCFWILEVKGDSATPGPGFHVSFRAKDRAEVHAFHAAALEEGAQDAGAPGPRPHYSNGFYGAFAIDAEGHKIEAVAREALR